MQAKERQISNLTNKKVKGIFKNTDSVSIIIMQKSCLEYKY